MKFVIPIFVGAIIGYITNWLAIKMLFRPYEKKYIFGLPVPFTPGLIPKEQKRIAKSVGETVGAYLLSEEVIMEEIDRAGLDQKIEDFILEKFKDLKESKLSLGDLVSHLAGGDYEDIREDWTRKISLAILSSLEDEKNKDRLLVFLDSLVDGLDYREGVVSLRELIEESLSNLEDSKELDYIIREELLSLEKKYRNDHRQLREILDEKVLEDFIDKNSYILVELIKDSIDDFTIADRVKELIGSLLEKNVSKTIRMFVSLDGMAEKIYRIVEGFIYSPDFEDRLRPIILSLGDKLLDYSPGELMDKFDRPIDIDGLAEFIGDKLKTGLARSNILDRIEEEAYSREDSFKSYLKNQLDLGYDKILGSEDFISLLEESIGQGLLGLGNKDLSGILTGREEEVRSMSERLSILAIGLIKTRTPGLIESFDVARVVEDEINKFEVDFAEEVILDIASKELKAITWLGALLGAIMGIISPLLQLL